MAQSTKTIASTAPKTASLTSVIDMDRTPVTRAALPLKESTAKFLSFCTVDGILVAGTRTQGSVDEPKETDLEELEVVVEPE